VRADSKLLILTPGEVAFLRLMMMNPIAFELEPGDWDTVVSLKKKLSEVENVYAARR
jgi:hypothetical protein